MEEYLVRYCAPTLASLKTASIVSVPDRQLLQRELCAWNRQLRQKGLMLLPLRRQKGRTLVYVYRPSQLEADLQRPGVAAFLQQLGYRTGSVGGILQQLGQRLRQSGGFPHEIGLFLGYPLVDVLGFIRNNGQNCKFCGCWKVYGDEQEARRRFSRFRRCSDLYARAWQRGTTVQQLTVAA